MKKDGVLYTKILKFASTKLVESGGEDMAISNFAYLDSQAPHRPVGI